jgi:hypothetical protein
MESDDPRPSNDQHPEAARWLRLAQLEIELRLGENRAEDQASWGREHQMQLILRARYPEVPIDLAIGFSDRLRNGDFTWDAFDQAVEWLEETKWFRRRRFETAA